MDLNKIVDAVHDNGLAIECQHPTDQIVHQYDPDSILGDSYWCGVCDMLLQVG